jgi:hypothetical protein
MVNSNFLFGTPETEDTSFFEKRDIMISGECVFKKCCKKYKKKGTHCKKCPKL